MSQIVSAYTLSSAALAEWNAAVVAQNPDAISRLLDMQAQEVTPHFEYSAYVVAVLAEFLDDNDATLPYDLSLLTAESLTSSDENLLLCASGSGAKEYLRLLKTKSFDEGAMRRYYEEFSDEEWSEAGQAMRSAFNFLRCALQQIENGDNWLLILVN